MHKLDGFMFGFIRDDEIDVAAIFGEGARKVKTGDAETSRIVWW